VAVVPRELGASDAVLQAFLVGDPHRTDTDMVRSELRSVLPPHMVPSHYQWIDAIPLTPSGKRDDAALRAITVRGPDGGASPGDDLEEAIADLLAEFAGIDDLAVDTSFFDAGGTSIGATRVSMTIARRWGVDLPLQTFLAAPTARQLAGIVRSRDARRTFDPVVPLREPGDQPPLFLVHPVGGNVLCYRELVEHLPGDRPVYGLQAAGAEPGTEPLTSMESLAASYVAAIRRIHPEGAFHIAGWSFGGYVAVEIARQLNEAEVSSLTLLDTIALGAGPRPLIDEKRLVVLFFRELLRDSAGETAMDKEFDEEFGAEVGAEFGAEFDAGGQDLGPLFESVFRKTVELGILPEDGSPQLLCRLYEVFRANYRATVGYRPEKVRRPFLVLRAADELPAGIAPAHRIFGSLFNSPGNGWQNWADHPVETVEVPGDHLSMMGAPHVSVLAGELGSALSRADSRPGIELGAAR
jgi:thioesterase domain-containing protein/acyl carrier protein